LKNSENKDNVPERVLDGLLALAQSHGGAARHRHIHIIVKRFQAMHLYP
jgi:hypothetical protein